MTGTRHRITVLVMARAGLVAVHSVLARLTGHVTVGAIKSCVTKALSGDDMADSVKTVAAVVLTVFAICAVGATHLAPVPYPARVTVRALAVNGVAVVAVLTGGTHFLAVFAKEALGAELIAPRPVPASVTGDATSLCHLTGLLAFAVSASVPAVLTVESSGTRFPAELPTVPWRAGARAIGLVTLAVDALAVSLAPRAPQPLPALTTSRELFAR